MVETGPSTQAAFNRMGRSPGATAGIVKSTWYEFTVPGIPNAWTLLASEPSTVTATGESTAGGFIGFKGNAFFQVNIGEGRPEPGCEESNVLARNRRRIIAADNVWRFA
jgi:hypothetical protein